jgi:hypothetical protein
MEEQMVYGLRLFNGKGYSSSFCPPSENTLYIIADSDNVFLPKMTLVYYWPITRRYRAAFKSLDKQIEGVLEILQNGKIIQKLKLRKYTFLFTKGWYSGKSVILLDDESREKYKEYRANLEDYFKRLKTYNIQRKAYHNKLEKILDEIAKREKSVKTAEQFGPIEIPQEPEPPSRPKYFVEEIKEQFVVNLPIGKYNIRLRGPDGKIIEESEKKLISFTYRRSGQVGYEIIPEKRWTRPMVSSDPSEIIYLEGKNTLFFKSFFQLEYNDFLYAKLNDPQNDGHPEIWNWVPVKQVQQGTLQVLRNNQVIENIEEKPYYVQQIPGPELGYKIIEYQKSMFPDRTPSYVGYKLTFVPEVRSCRIQLLDDHGKPIPGSIRELRAVEVNKIKILYISAVILPLAVGTSVIILRRLKRK